MFRWIKHAADELETKAPSNFILGLKIATVSWIIGMLGMVEAFTVNSGLGGLVARISVFSGGCGIVLCSYAFAKDMLRKRRLGKEIKEKYENSKQPWE